LKGSSDKSNRLPRATRRSAAPTSDSAAARVFASRHKGYSPVFHIGGLQTPGLPAFRSDNVFVVDVDVVLKAPGLKGLLSVTDDEVGTNESGSVEIQPGTASQEVNWDW
jgi:hypothetical protein